MPTNKHAIIRCQALDRCFSNRYRKYYIDDLIEACNKALEEFYCPKEDEYDSFYVKRRTIFNDIAYMESPEGWNAPVERIYEGHRCYYRYQDPDFSINRRDFSEGELDILDDALVMLERFKGAEGFDWIDEFVTNFQDKLGRRRNTVPVIGYQRNPFLTGIENLSVLYKYIVNRQVVRITYRHFTRGEMVHVVHPYYLKEYNDRWFLFGITERKKDSLISLPLDRIAGIEPVHADYIPNTRFDFGEYFDDIVGVTVPPSAPVEEILLKFSPQRLPYVLTKPLHPSQRVLDRDNGVIQLNVMVNNELKALIHSFWGNVEVLAPEHLRDEIRDEIRDALSKY